MKKLLSILLAAALLLSGLAFAQGTELRLSDLVISINDGEANLDLSGVGLRLALAGTDTASGLCLGVTAADEPVTAVTAMLEGGKLLLGMDGVSDTYSVDLGGMLDSALVDLESVMGSFDLMLQELQIPFAAFLGEVMGTLAPMENNDPDAIDTQYYSFNVSEEALNSLYHAVAETLDKYPEIANSILNVEGKYNSCVEYCELNPLRLSAAGAYSESENELALRLCISNGDEAEKLELYCRLTSGDAVVTEDVAGELYIELNAVDADMNLLREGIVSIITIYENAQSGEIDKLEGCVISPTGGVDENGREEFEGICFGALSAERSPENAVHIYVSDWNDDVYAELLIAEDSYGVRYHQPDMEVGIFYTPDPAADHTKGMLEINYLEDDHGLTASASFEAVESDGSWLNLSGDGAVNALALDDAQQQKFTTELMGELMRMISALASANQTIAALLSAL